MNTITITVSDVTAGGFTADVLKDPETSINRAALRRLIVDLAASYKGTDFKGMRDRGYDVDRCTDGWETSAEPVPGGRRLLRFTVRPLTERERRAKLAREGGFIENPDGSMGFVFPQPARRGEVRVNQQGKVKARKTHKAPEPQAKPAEPTSPERMDRPRLK